jgi:ribonucleoside-diphosphate reductase beta chain
MEIKNYLYKKSVFNIRHKNYHSRKINSNQMTNMNTSQKQKSNIKNENEEEKLRDSPIPVIKHYDNIEEEDMAKKTKREREPLMVEQDNRYVLYPIQHQDVFDEYKKQMSCFWTAQELDFSQDLTDWKKLTDNEKHFIKHVLAFFAASDGVVMENLGNRFMSEVQWMEAKLAYGFQNMMEGIHSETYSLMINTFIDDPKEKDSLFRAIETIPCVAKKAEWAIKWINDRRSNFATRLVAFAAVEGIFFSGSFCSIYWLKRRNLMPGLTTSNEFIARDEGLHTDFAVLLYSKIIHRLKPSKLKRIITEAVNIEKEFICESLPCALLGMNAKLMSEYIEYVADRLVVQLGYSKIYDTVNPFDFMENISLEGKDNFFEKRVSNYAKAGVGATKEQMEIKLDDDDF